MSDINKPDLNKRKIRTESGCPFCRPAPGRIAAEEGTVIAIQDTSPVSTGHLLIVPRRHCRDYFEMTGAERRDTHRLLSALREKIMAEDATVTGFNIGINCGMSAGQTIFHAHIHLIPRRNDDTPYPRGGVRGVIPDKMDY